MNHGLACDALTVTVDRSDGGRRCILDGVSAAFSPGRVHLVRGNTGAGKTTLLHCLSCLRRPTSGVVTADGQPVSRWRGRHRDVWRRRVGLVFQGAQLLENLTAAENVMLPLIPRRVPPSTINSRCRAAMAALDIGHLARQPVTDCSGGERQRIAMARAVITEPNFLIADEPSSQQDVTGVEMMAATLMAAARRGATVVAATHDPRLDARMPASVFHHLANGRLETLP